MPFHASESADLAVSAGLVFRGAFGAHQQAAKSHPVAAAPALYSSSVHWSVSRVCGCARTSGIVDTVEDSLERCNPLNG